MPPSPIVYDRIRRGPTGSLPVPGLLARSLHRGLKLVSTPLRDLPGVLIIGAEKSGTTSLYRYLISHPLVATPEKKEIRYLLGPNDLLGRLWYKSHFPLRTLGDAPSRRRTITLDATPSYLFDPWSPRRAHEIVPNARILVLLRHPVHRAVSHYRHWFRMGWEHQSFESAINRPGEQIDHLRSLLKAEPEDLAASIAAFRKPCYLARGIYSDQLERWLNWFRRDQILAIKSEDFFAEPGSSFDRILRFLELPQWSPSQFNPENEARGFPPALPSGLFSELVSFFEVQNARLSALIPGIWSWN